MYNDKITWYLNENNFNSCTYQFFTRIIGCSDENTDYTTLKELNSFPLSIKQQEFPVYSVELNGEGRLVLSLDLYPERFVPTSIALISLDHNNSPFIIAKIVTSGNGGSTQVSASISRIFDIPIPRFKVGNTYEYPSFETVYKRKSGTPIGEEKVMIGEHHHAVQTNGVNDSYPSLYSGQDNFILSAKNALPSNIKADSKSYVYGERGILENEYTDLLGVKSTQNSINIADRNISAELMADILADVLEVIIMANNKIQILGKNIPLYDKNIPAENGKQYILMADSISQSNNRNLEAVDTETFKSWIIGKKTVTTSGSVVVLNSTISVIKSSVNFKMSPNGKNKLAIVANTKSVISSGDKSNLDDNDIEVTLTGSSSGDVKFKIHAGSIRYFYFDGSTWEEYYDNFAYDTLTNVLSGNFKFDKLNVTNKISSDSLEVTKAISSDSLSVTKTISSNDLSVTNAISSKSLSTTDATISNNLSVTKAITSDSLSVTNAISSDSLSVTKTISSNDLSVTNAISSKSLSATDATISNDLTVTNAVSSKSISTTDASISNNLTVTKAISSDSLSVTNAISSKSLSTEDATISNDLTVTSNITSSSLTAGTITSNGAIGADSLTVTNSISSDSLSVTNAISSDSLSVTNAVSSGSLSVTNAISSDSLSVTNGVSASSLSATSATISDSLSVTNSTTSGSLSVTNAISSDSLSVTNAISSGSLSVTNDISSKTISATESISTPSLTSTTSKLGTITGINNADITLSSAKLKFGNSYISSDNSASFGNGVSTFGTGGVFTTTSNIQAPSIKNGTIGISMSSDTVSVSGKLSGSSGSLSLSSITVDKIILGGGSIRYNSGFEFYNGDLSSWGNIKTSGVYIQ